MIILYFKYMYLAFLEKNKPTELPYPLSVFSIIIYLSKHGCTAINQVSKYVAKVSLEKCYPSIWINTPNTSSFMHLLANYCMMTVFHSWSPCIVDWCIFHVLGSGHDRQIIGFILMSSNLSMSAPLIVVCCLLLVVVFLCHQIWTWPPDC